MDDRHSLIPAAANGVDVERLADRIDEIIDSSIRAQTKILAILFFTHALIIAGLAFAAARLT